MINGKKVVVIMPAYNAEKTLEKTFSEIYKEIVDSVILVDDNSIDNTKDVSKSLGITTIVHRNNMGYGANQKSCYIAALQDNADIVVMLHPDYQYTPKLIPAMSSMIAFGEYDAVVASRMLTGSALNGGMPFYKFLSNKFLTWFQNLLIGKQLSEYHSGFRAFSAELLKTLPLGECDDDFIFDNQMLSLAFFYGFKIGEISCPTKYFPDASSINLKRSIKYGCGVLIVSVEYFLANLGVFKSKIFKKDAKRLNLQKELEFYNERV